MPKVIIKKAPVAKSGKTLSPEKAREMLHDGTAHGKKLTEKQRKFFGWKSHQKADDGTVIPIGENTIQFNGKSHKQGGMDITYGGHPVEVEGGETAYKSMEDNSLHIMGNMINPLTGKKFKQDSKNLAKKERKLDDLLDYSTALVTETDPFSKWGMLKFNAGAAMGKGAIRKKQEIRDSKEWLATLQNTMLEKSEELGVDAQDFSKGRLTKAKYGATIKAADGRSIDPGDEYLKMARAAATKYGIDPEIIVRLIRLESGANSKVRASDKGALGIMQFMEGTAKQYGITKAQLKSTNPKDVEAVIDAGIHHFKDLVDQNKGDYKLALAAYNGGQGAVNFVKKKLGKQDITGDEWLDFMTNRQETSPSKDRHAWQNETLDYVMNIIATDEADFNKKRTSFNQKYYSPDYDKLRKTTKDKYSTDLVENEELNRKVRDYKERYNPTTVQLENYKLSLQEPQKYSKPSNRKGLSAEQILPELYSMATNKEEPVWLQQYNPELYQPYQVSFQDRLNENNATFSNLTRMVKDNPSALGSLASQKYLADSGVLGEEFRTNQGIEADITAKNIALLNDSKLKNLGLADQQYVRQAQAKSNTKAQNMEVLKSVSDKLVLNRYEQMTQGIYENLYPHYSFDPNTGEVGKVGAPGQEYINWQGTGDGMNNAEQKVRTTYDPVTGKAKQVSVTEDYPSSTGLRQQKLQELQTTAIPRRIKTNLNIFGSNPVWNSKGLYKR